MAVVVADTLENAHFAASLFELRLRGAARAALRGRRAGAAGARRRERRPDPPRQLPTGSFRQTDEEKLQDRRAPTDRTRGATGVALALHDADERALSDRAVRRPSRTGTATSSPCTTAPAGSPASARRWPPTSGIPEDRSGSCRRWSAAPSARRASCGCTWSLCAVAAREVGRPVKLVLTRDQMFSSTGHRPRTEQDSRWWPTRTAGSLSTEHHTLTETSTVAHFCEPAGLSSPLPLRLPAAGRCPTGRPESTHPHRVSCAVPVRHPACSRSKSRWTNSPTRPDVDPARAADRNHADIDQASGRAWSGKHLRECYQQGAERFGWHDRPRRRARCAATASRSAGAWRPRPIRAAGWRRAAGSPPMPTGWSRFASATHEVGNGVRTVMTQVAADVTGLPLDAGDLRVR